MKTRRSTDVGGRGSLFYDNMGPKFRSSNQKISIKSDSIGTKLKKWPFYPFLVQVQQICKVSKQWDTSIMHTFPDVVTAHFCHSFLRDFKLYRYRISPCFL